MRTEKQETFIEQYCLTGNAAASAELAGYSSPKQRGYELKNKFASDIEERQKKMLQDCVPAALAQLQTLVVSAESESVKLGANPLGLTMRKPPIRKPGPNSRSS